MGVKKKQKNRHTKKGHQKKTKKKMACVLEPHRRPGQAATAESMSVVACTLCTAPLAGRHSLTVQRASRMLEAVLDATQLTGADRALVERAFQPDPIPTENENREEELAVVREAIVAHTDAALEADVPEAAEALMCVLESTTGKRRGARQVPRFRVAARGAVRT